MLKNNYDHDDKDAKSIGFVLLLLAPSLVLYWYLIQYFNPIIGIDYHTISFFLLFAFVGSIPFLKSDFLKSKFEILTFISLSLFGSHISLVTAKYNFSIDYLLGSYIAIFGGILILKNRFYLVVYCVLYLMLYIYLTNRNPILPLVKSSILLSISAIILFSFIIQNGFIVNKNRLQQYKKALEQSVNERTQTIKNKLEIIEEKNKELEEFAYIISHDLKKPLNNIYTLTQWIEADTVLEATVVGHFEKIKEQVQHMHLLVDGVLEYTIESNPLLDDALVDLEQIILSLIDLNASENCTFIKEGIFPKMKINKTQIIQVFQNLIQNAIKHNPDVDLIIRLKSKYIPESNEYQFSIIDNGKGIEEKYHHKIFQIFQKLDANVGSTGIGLSLVKKIITKSGGIIKLNSEKNEGAAFFFTLPFKN